MVGLLRGSERADRHPDPRGSAAPEQAFGGLLPGLAKAILPISVLFALILLFEGHNAPGGGFVAGLSLAVGAMLGLIAFGSTRFGRRSRLSLSAVAILGCGLTLASARPVEFWRQEILVEIFSTPAFSKTRRRVKFRGLAD